MVSVLFKQIALYQRAQKLVAVDLADQAAGIAVVGNVGGVLGEEVAYDLVDRIVTLFA